MRIERIIWLECDEHGHRFFTPETAQQVERLFEDDRLDRLTPDDTMLVPVVILKRPA